MFESSEKHRKEPEAEGSPAERMSSSDKASESVRALTDRLAEKEESVQALISTVAEKELSVRTLAKKAEEKDRFLRELSIQAAEKDLAIEELTSELYAVKYSKAWRTVLVLKRIRDRLAPQGSFRDRLLRGVAGIPFRIVKTWRTAQHLQLIRASELFDARWYELNYPDVRKVGQDPARHYLLFGGFEGRNPGPNFSSAWYLETYADVAARNINPLVHYLKYGRQQGRQPDGRGASAPGPASNRAPAEKSDFDKAFYLRIYPDVLRSGVDPYLHYQLYGKREGRLGKCPDLNLQDGLTGYDPSRENVLVVSHEASRTGAPVVSLNIARRLQRDYNVVSLLLGGGSMIGEFREASAVLAGPLPLKGNPAISDGVLDQLNALYKIKFAIVNSIESRAVLPGLAARFIPAVSLIHEFAAYMRPKGIFSDAVFWAQETVFSASVTRDNAVFEYPEFADYPFHIIPQGRCALPAVQNDPKRQAVERARILRVIRPQNLPADTAVVLGIGTVHLRKGVDLFIDCASRLLQSGADRPFRFIWIGRGFDPENDLGYSVYLADQIRRSGLERHVFFLGETLELEAAYDAADLLLLSSRLDPLPNVAIDAMIRGLPVVCFARTTGVADVLAEHAIDRECVAPYLDTAAMAEKVKALLQREPLRQNVGGRLKQLAEKAFDMGTYVDRLKELGRTAGDRIAREQKDVEQIEDTPHPRLDFFLPPYVQLVSRTQAIRSYVRSWAGGVGRRKLFPGFHPGIYSEQNGMRAADGDPLAAYLRAHQPAGPWRSELITSEGKYRAVPSKIRIALHLHVFYPDLLPDILARLTANRVRPDLFVSVPTEAVREEVRKILKGYPGKAVEIRKVPNRGRDIGPFLAAFGPAWMDGYDVVGHIHTKKTASIEDLEMGKIWRTFLLENLVGGKCPMADRIIGCMETDKTIGMVFPEDPHVVGWGKNRSFAESLCGKLGIESLPEYFNFPVGTMFWARSEALQPLWALGWNWEDFPLEPLPDDGSLLHALERLLPFVAAQGGFRSAMTNVTGVTR